MLGRQQERTDSASQKLWSRHGSWSPCKNFPFFASLIIMQNLVAWSYHSCSTRVKRTFRLGEKFANFNELFIRWTNFTFLIISIRLVKMVKIRYHSQISLMHFSWTVFVVINQYTYLTRIGRSDVLNDTYEYIK